MSTKATLFDNVDVDIWKDFTEPEIIHFTFDGNIVVNVDNESHEVDIQIKNNSKLAKFFGRHGWLISYLYRELME